jgi:hypothetical protein
LPRPALLLTPEAASTDAQGMSLRPAAILLVCAAAAAMAQAPLAEKAPPATLPPALALPWRLIGIDPARAGAARAALEASERALAAAVLDAPKTLTELGTPFRSVPLNGRRIADEIRVGALKGKTGLLPLAIEPAWSSLLDHELLTVTVADAARNVLLGSAHVAVPRTQWPARGLDGFLGAQLTTLAGRALEQAAAHPLARPAATASDALHVGVSLGRDTTRRDEGPSHALTMLLEEALAPRYTVARALGGDKLALVRELLGLPSALRRPTRGLVLRWFHDPELKAVELVRPSPAKSRGKPAAANFGKKLSRPPEPSRQAAPGRNAGRHGPRRAPGRRPGERVGAQPRSRRHDRLQARPGPRGAAGAREKVAARQRPAASRQDRPRLGLCRSRAGLGPQNRRPPRRPRRRQAGRRHQRPHRAVLRP